MSITLEKLRHLWHNRRRLISEHTGLASRFDRIYQIAEQWDLPATRATLEAIEKTDCGGPMDADIPTDEGWGVVLNNFTTFYNRDEVLKAHTEQITQVFDLLHVGNRKEDFRLASTARGDQHHENSKTKPSTFSNPESWFASHHFPFEIIRFYLSCRDRRDALDFVILNRHEPDLPGEAKFVTKFLWMLANRDQFFPVLSLRSYLNLAPILRELVGGFEWNSPWQGNWTVWLRDFAGAWPAAAPDLYSEISGNPSYSEQPTLERRLFAQFLFVASLSDAVGKLEKAVMKARAGNRAMIFYGPPGTGKTYDAKLVARALIERGEDDSADAPPADEPDKDDPDYWLEKKSAPTNDTPATASTLPPDDERCGIVQFHPAYSYQDFIGGIVPNVNDKEGLSYRLENGAFKRFCDLAAQRPHESFVLIIDEINRANVSAVFGEVLYALEYRGEAIKIPYFGQFVVPRNVYLIGTMNTVDKSLDSFDLALRRRFLFMKHPPDTGALYDWNDLPPPRGPRVKIDLADLTDLAKRADQLNAALVAPESSGGLDRSEDHGIGHAYFMKIPDFCEPNDEGSLRITVYAREQLWVHHLEPLIEEYLGAEFAARRPVVARLRDAFVKGEPGS